MVRHIGNINVTIAIHGDAIGFPELARIAAEAAKQIQVNSSRRELLDPAVVRIGDKDISRRVRR